jgi:hypothetical protein
LNFLIFYDFSEPKQAKSENQAKNGPYRVAPCFRAFGSTGWTRTGTVPGYF